MVVGDVVLCIALPVLSLATFFAGLIRRGRCPGWLLVVALVPAAATLAVVLVGLLVPGDSIALPLGLAAWLSSAIGMLLWALLSQHRGRPRRGLALLGLALPLPVLALFMYGYIAVHTQQDIRSLPAGTVCPATTPAIAISTRLDDAVMVRYLSSLSVSCKRAAGRSTCGGPTSGRLARLLTSPQQAHGRCAFRQDPRHLVKVAFSTGEAECDWHTDQ